MITDAADAPGRVVGVVACAEEALNEVVERIVELGEGLVELVGVLRVVGVVPVVVLVVVVPVRLAVTVEDVIGRRVAGVVVVDAEAVDTLLGDRVEGVDDGLAVSMVPELEATLLVALARARLAAVVDRDGVEGDLRTVEVVVGLGFSRLAVVVVVVVGRVGVVREAVVEEVAGAPLRLAGIGGLALLVVDDGVVAGGVLVRDDVGFNLDVNVEGFVVLASGFLAATVGFVAGFGFDEVVISAAGKRTMVGSWDAWFGWFDWFDWFGSEGVETEAMDRVEALANLASVDSRDEGASPTVLTALMLTVAVLVSLIRVRSGLRRRVIRYS